MSFPLADAEFYELADFSWFYGSSAFARSWSANALEAVDDDGMMASGRSNPRHKLDAVTYRRQNGIEIKVAQQCSSMKWLLKVFETFDENKDGVISVDELKRSFERLGFESSNVHCLLRYTAPSNGSQKGHVSQEDFLLLYHGAACNQCASNLANIKNDNNGIINSEDDNADEELLWDAFNVFDKDGDGFITPSELQSVLCSLGFGAAQEIDACIEMIKGHDQDGDGQVNFAEFKDMLNSVIKQY
ncbi:hypothetical protein KP509_04G031000 [Ceratopteris richardii]|uniref:EF-hand domain-containing protein n=2 Tax=Ceratopteris richardii TaxID=49495 RepID=A0A8T2UVL5_CERRI|nr:hypothetical protein KP509_04G031000 [Ceratopteris richardii]KAH7438778.1 hypothetical protein KP509_04G031000 [Ceratopteris richardii]KAH7438779.1 hypothetical protein KP509_04G031000 [Ceratopteris richardii]